MNTTIKLPVITIFVLLLTLFTCQQKTANSQETIESTKQMKDNFRLDGNALIIIEDYMLISIYLCNNMSPFASSSENRKKLSDIANPVLSKYNLANSKISNFVEFPDDALLLFDNDSKLFVPSFGKAWIELIPLFFNKRGKFPEIFFRNGKVSIQIRDKNSKISFLESTELKVNNKIYKYQDSNWLLQK